MKYIILGALFSFIVSCAATPQRPQRKVAKPRPTQSQPVKVGGMGSAPQKAPSPSSGQPTTPPAVSTTPAQQALEFEKAGDYLGAVDIYSKDPQYQAKTISIIQSLLNDEELEYLVSDSNYGPYRGYAAYRLGEILLKDKDSSGAKKYFAKVGEYLPDSDLAARSNEILVQLDNARRVSAQTVGVVLPLSGKAANVGQRALRGINMGLGLHLPGSSFKVAVIDSEGNPDVARRGVEKLITEDNTIAVIGSLLSKTATSVASKAEEYSVPMIGLSQRSGLTDIGPSIFRNALTGEMQVRHLVRHAMEVQKMKKFAILYPNDAYGVEYANLFWDEVLARGGQVVGAQTYNPKETDFRYPVQRLVGTYFAEARMEEFRAKQKETLANDKKRFTRKETAENLLPPIVDFDALFIPDNTRALGQIAAMLSFNDVKNLPLLGTNLWNTPDLAKRAGNFAHNVIFVDSYYPQMNSRFVNEYKTLFGESPSLIDIQAYDSALVLRQLIVSGASSRSDVVSGLANLKAFPGAVGNLSTSPNREIQRPVQVLSLDKLGQIIPLGPQ